MSVQTITLTGYSAQTATGGLLQLGTWDSYGIEQLQIVPGPEWAGLTITATFVTPNSSTRMVVPASGLVDVPPEATAQALTVGKPGVIVFAGVSDGVQRITTNVYYIVANHAPVDGDAPEPTPGPWEQFVSQVQQSAQEAAESATAAGNSATQAAQSAVNASNSASAAAAELEKVQDASTAALTAIGNAQSDATQAVEQAGSTQTDAVNAAGQAQQTAIQQAGEDANTQVQQAGTEQVDKVTQAGNAKLQQIADINALLPTPTAADAGKVVSVNSDGTGYVLSDQMFDLLYANQLNGTNTSSVFGRYAAALAAQGVAVGEILRRWFNLLWDDNTYGVKFYKFDTSATPDGELIQSSAELGAATPGTNTTAAQDPYFEHGAFWAVEVAYEIEDKEVAIKAVAGVNGVTRAALLSGQYGMVGVAQKTGWYADTEDDSYYYHYYRAAPANFVTDANAYKPLPEGVALDGSVRPYVVHAKYMAGRGADGKLTSASGLAAVNFISMQSQATEWRKRGADYCGICGCDLSFRMRMFWMKYGKKGNSGTLEGCSNYDDQRIAKVSETGVKRVLLTASDAASYLVGSTVSVGDKGTGTSTDRGVSSMHALADKVRILSIEDVQVEGTGYKALNLDAPATFDTVAGETYISTMPWHSGSCDNVKGADGSPTSCTSGKEPYVLQLLECQPGGYAISADQLTEQVLTEDAYTHRLVCFRQAAQIATSITSNAVRSPVVLTMPTNQAANWLYQKDVEIDADGNMYAVAVGSPAGSTTGCRAAVFVPAAGSRVFAWWAWAGLSYGGNCGLSCGNANNSCGNANWNGKEMQNETDGAFFRKACRNHALCSRRHGNRCLDQKKYPRRTGGKYRHRRIYCRMDCRRGLRAPGQSAYRGGGQSQP